MKNMQKKREMLAHSPSLHEKQQGVLNTQY